MYYYYHYLTQMFVLLSLFDFFLSDFFIDLSDSLFFLLFSFLLSLLYNCGDTETEVNLKRHMRLGELYNIPLPVTK